MFYAEITSFFFSGRSRYWQTILWILSHNVVNFTVDFYLRCLFDSVKIEMSVLGLVQLSEVIIHL